MPAPAIPPSAPANFTLINRLQKLRRRALAAQSSNPVDLAVLSTPPTVTNAFDGTLVDFFAYASKPQAFNFFGGRPTALNGGYSAATDAGIFGLTSVEFSTAAPKIQIRGTQGNYRIVVNGQFTSKSGHNTAASGGEQQIVLDWSGVRAQRKYRVTTAGAFYRVGLGGLDTLSAPTADDVVRAVWDGDSYTAGTGASYAGDAYAGVAADLLGWQDSWINAVGGTGWLNPGTATTMRGRIAGLVSAAPDIVLLAAGTNDGAYTAGAITAEVLTYLSQLRAALPNVPIVVLGTWPKNTGPSAIILAVEAAVAAGVTALGDPRTVFAPVAADPSRSWIFGTGTTSALANNGNADVFIGSDGTHPNDAGHEYLGRRTAEAIRTALLAMPQT